MKKPILSQCMIVKNEERNIEKALLWGRGIVSEQIVADTGSTDRTREIAERMGAKVFDFKWIGDFAAAKNFAIEQASGDWIAFLDADEYFPAEDAKLLLSILRQVESDKQMSKKCLAVSCPMHQLGDEGKTMDINMQVRLFRNIPRVRYTGRIHEQLNIGAQDIIRTGDIKIMHTGYSDSAYENTDKLTRNIEMLRDELSVDPSNLRMKLYLADSLSALSVKNNDSKLADESKTLYIEVTRGGAELDDEYKKIAIKNLMSKYSKSADTDTELDAVCDNAIKEFSDDYKVLGLYAAVLIKKELYSEALEILLQAERLMKNNRNSDLTASVQDEVFVYTQMVYAAQSLGDYVKMLEYTAMMVMLDRNNTNILSNYIKLMLKQQMSLDNVLEILAMIYNFGNRDDISTVAAAMRECGLNKLAQAIEGG